MPTVKNLKTKQKVWLEYIAKLAKKRTHVFRCTIRFHKSKKMKCNDFYVTVKIVFNFGTVSTVLQLAFLLLEFIYLEFFI